MPLAVTAGERDASPASWYEVAVSAMPSHSGGVRGLKVLPEPVVSSTGTGVSSGVEYRRGDGAGAHADARASAPSRLQEAITAWQCQAGARSSSSDVGTIALLYCKISLEIQISLYADAHRS